MRQFYDDSIRIQRLKATSGNKREYVATATGDTSLQPLGKDRGQVDIGVFGNSFVAYVDPDIPAAVGDRVVNKNGTAFQVTEVILRDFGAFPYKELILKKS